MNVILSNLKNNFFVLLDFLHSLSCQERVKVSIMVSSVLPSVTQANSFGPSNASNNISYDTKIPKGSCNHL